MLDKKYYKVVLDIKNNTVDQPTLIFSTADKNTSDFYIEVLRDNVKVNLEGHKITLNVRKPNVNLESKVLTYSKDIEMIYCNLEDYFRTVEGKYIADIVIENSENEVIATSQFTYVVKDDVYNAFTKLVQSSKELPFLEKLIQDVQKVNYIDDSSISKTTTNSSEKINQQFQQIVENTNTKFTEVDTQIKENKKNIDFINLSNFGDGFLNFKKAIDYCKVNNKNLNIDIDVNLKNTEPILIDFNLTINCNYKMFKMDNDLFLCSGSLFIDKIIVDEKESGFYKVCYLKNGGQLICTNSKFLNFKNLNAPKECIIFDVENGSKSYFNNIEVNNIKSIGNGTVTDGIGSQRFIRTKTNANDSDEIGTTVIKNIFITDFYNINNQGNPVTEDSDPIVFQHGVKMFHNSIVENVKGKNIGKRLIKVQSPNVSINNIYLNNKNFSGEVTAISIQRNVTNVVVDGLEVQGNFIESRAVETFDCENITISNVTLNVRSLKTQSGCAFIIGGKNIKLNNIKGNVGGFLTFINEGTQNITVENVDLNVEYYSIYYGDFKNGLKANIKFNNVNLNYRDNSFPFQCVIFRNGTNIINDVYFNNSNFNLLNSYNYGVLSLIYCNNFHFRNCNLNTKSIGYGVYLNNSTDILINNTFIDKLTINIANCYLLNSKIDNIESISNNNKILISSLLSEPSIKHSAGSSQGVLVKPHNIS